ncbi:hypothetical protein ACFFKH_09750 [Micromonospora marina]|uniref:hypothetical protein n=1 Tax=Micromonospora marina TaxID=307120 RepID=UPI001FC96F83|nr:hypothetical protein [Micromonospora marina]
MDLIVTALGAGAAAGLTGAASTAVKDAYVGLKRLLRPWVRGGAREALEADETEPGIWQARLGAEITASGADLDEEVLAAARQLLQLASPPAPGKYEVKLSQAKGVQIGDLSVQTNHF